jgi:hypothetical protein
VHLKLSLAFRDAIVKRGFGGYGVAFT